MKTKFLLKTSIFGDGQNETRNGDKNNSWLLDNSKERVIKSLKIVLTNKYWLNGNWRKKILVTVIIEKCRTVRFFFTEEMVLCSVYIT